MLDLTKIDSYVINLDHQPDRFKIVSDRLSSKGLKFERFPAVSLDKSVGTGNNIKGMLGCSLSHLNLLKQLKAPFIIFEDDVEFTQFWTNELDIPTEADALHLGASRWGYVKPNLRHAYRDVVLASQYSTNFKRVYNMCSTHAIVYLNDVFIDKVIKAIEKSIASVTHWDLALASIQKDFVYLIPNNPFVYQDNMPEETNITILP